MTSRGGSLGQYRFSMCGAVPVSYSLARRLTDLIGFRNLLLIGSLSLFDGLKGIREDASIQAEVPSPCPSPSACPASLAS